jgi:uncharacterized protein YndB with AHSA1/START domain
METAARYVKLTAPSAREVRYERVLDAPLPLVWRAFTEPDLVARWWGRGHRMTIERYEVERGGHWRVVEHAPEGDEGFEGRFREVLPERRLVETWEWDGLPGYVSLNTAEFEALPDDRTKVTETTLFLTTEERDGMVGEGMEQGLNMSLAALDDVLDSLK